MGFISSIFTTYSNYLAWLNGKSHIYHVVLTNTTTLTSQTIKNNPIGITETGKHFERHEVYHGIFTNISLKIDFVNRVGYGGDFIKAEYDTRGIKGTMNADLYKYNPNTNDYDIFYRGKIDFSEESYDFDANENIISVNLIEQGKVNKLLSRDEIDVNLRGYKSIEGLTITPFSDENRTTIFPKVDIPFLADMDVDFSTTDSGTSSDTIDTGALALSIATNQLDDRTQINETTRTKIAYSNTTTEAREVRLKMNGLYNAHIAVTPTNAINTTNIIISGLILNGIDTEYFIQKTINRTNLTTTDNIYYTDELIDGYYIFTVPAGLSLEVFVKIEINVFNTNWNILTHSVDVPLFELVDISEGVPDFAVRCFRMEQALARLDRILTDETVDSRIIYSSVYGGADSEDHTYALNGDGYRDELTNGWQLRGALNRSFITKFRKVFKTFYGT